MLLGFDLPLAPFLTSLDVSVGEYSTWHQALTLE